MKSNLRIVFLLVGSVLLGNIACEAAFRLFRQSHSGPARIHPSEVVGVDREQATRRPGEEVAPQPPQAAELRR